MFVNLDTLECDPNGASVLLSYSSTFASWIAVVRTLSPQPPAGTIELTWEELKHIGHWQTRRGQTPQQALATVLAGRDGPKRP